MNDAVYVVDGLRSPFLKALGKPNKLSAADLATQVGNQLLLRHDIPLNAIETLILGCVAPNSNEANIARIVALRLGFKHDSTAYTVARNCASGLEAIDQAYKDILLGRSDLVLAGGTEAMSKIPLTYPETFTSFLAELTTRRDWQQKLLQITKFRLAYLKPIIGVLQGLTDQVVGISMGQTAENLAYKYNISRAEMDAFAVESHKRAADAHLQEELAALVDYHGKYYLQDEGIRLDSSVEKLAKLKPVFDRPFGQVTAGNSSQISDGAAMLLLASKKAVADYGLKPLGKIKGVAWSGLNPSEMGLGPVFAINKLYKEHQLDSSRVDYFEINEAFAAQVLACNKELNINPKKLNIDGGAIALGHPVGASGARLVLHLLHTLNKLGAKKGIASLCIGGGQGGTILVESV